MLSYSIANKLCKRCQLFGQHHAHQCSANYPLCSPIGNAETTLASQNISSMENMNPPDIVVTDNDGKICSGMNKLSKKTILKEDCRVHVSRGQRRLAMATKWSTAFAGKMSAKSRISFVQDLAQATSKRCAGELLGACKQAQSYSQFVDVAIKAKDTILSCFQGDHSECTKSFVCPKHFRRTPHCRHLPRKKYLSNMTKEDKALFKRLVDYKLSPKMIRRQFHNLSTNASEAFHKRVFRSVPKANTFSRNVYGRVATQIVVASMGKTKGIARVCGSVSASFTRQGPGLKALTQISKSDLYFKHLRQQTAAKSKRKILDRQRQCNRRKTGSLYQSSHLHPHLTSEHSYAEK